ncbi:MULTISPECIES: RICIN domain-containing protein [unclassified Streptomyces]|uniref:RICIN domain-containing protein n=1 Tax=unclassified Streptomyces TaxID=2593676 RepID=UPI00381A05ED
MTVCQVFDYGGASMRVVLRVLPSVAGSVLVLCALASPAAATGQGSSALSTAKPFKNAATARCMDGSRLGLRALVCNKTSFQRWSVIVSPGGSRQLKNAATAQCLDDGRRGLHLAACNKTRFQQWTVSTVGAHAQQLKNAATQRCLDDSKYGLRAIPCNKAAFQRWS